MHNIIEKKVNTKIWNIQTPIDCDQACEFDKQDYEERVANLWAMPQVEEYSTIVIYGDREHYSNLYYFTGYDPRWEESLLILSRDKKPQLLVGNEGIGYVKKVLLDVDIIFYQSFSLMGQPNDRSKKLSDIFKEYGFSKDGKIGIIGFKMYEEDKFSLNSFITDIPHYIVETLAEVVGRERMRNAVDLMADCVYGLKHHISAKEIVMFEAAGTKISRGVYQCLSVLKPGMSEMEASTYCGFDGSPANMHPNINFGDFHVSLGLNSPTDTERLAYGQSIGVGYGLRGSLVHKCGMYLRNKEDLPKGKEHYIEKFLMPYFNNVAAWYEMLKIGTSFGDIYEMVDSELGLKKYGCGLNPGHLTNTDEWTNSPFQKGNSVKVRSGMAIQCDYTVTWQEPFMSAHIEDGLAIADEKLQEEVKKLSPKCYERVLARKQWIEENLNIKLSQEVMPFSDLTCICFPYMADTSIVLARE